MKKLAVFASGNGSNFKAIYNQIQLGHIKAEVGLVVSDRPDAGVVKKANDANIPVFSFTPKNFASKADFERELVKVLRIHDIDWIILAGYMRLVGETLLKEYPNRIINIHPSLLPAFPGKDAVGQAYQAGVKITGVTIHFVDEGMDTGQIIAQQAIDITHNDTIESVTKKIHKVEHVLYPKVIQELVSK